MSERYAADWLTQAKGYEAYTHCVRDRETPGPLPYTFTFVIGTECKSWRDAFAKADELNAANKEAPTVDHGPPQQSLW